MVAGKRGAKKGNRRWTQMNADCRGSGCTRRHEMVPDRCIQGINRRGRRGRRGRREAQRQRSMESEKHSCREVRRTMLRKKLSRCLLRGGTATFPLGRLPTCQGLFGNVSVSRSDRRVIGAVDARNLSALGTSVWPHWSMCSTQVSRSKKS